MIPLATPRNLELVNLSQIIRVRTHASGRCDECSQIAEFEHLKSGSESDFKPIVHIVGEQSACTVYFSDGSSDIYSGDASKFLNIELHFALNAYRQWQQHVTSNIVGPDGQKPGLVM